MVGAQVYNSLEQFYIDNKFAGFKFHFSLVIFRIIFPGYVGYKPKIYPSHFETFTSDVSCIECRDSQGKNYPLNICQQRRYMKKVGKHPRPFRPLKMVSCSLK